MDLLSKLRELAKKHHPKIGMGSDDSKENRKAIEKSIVKANEQKLAEITIFNNPTELVNALRTGELSGAVRGTLPAKETLDDLKNKFKLVSLYRSALICIDNKYCFFLGPMGIDEGIFIDERFQFIKLTSSVLQQLDIPPKIAIISGGRLDDFGRSGVVDESLRAGKKLYKLAIDDGFHVKHHGILIEEAYTDANIIIAPNTSSILLTSNCRIPIIH